MPLPRPCLNCGTLTRNPSRCTQCQTAWNQRRGSATQRGYDTAWQRLATQAITNHRAMYGEHCPGWRDHQPHTVIPPNKLTADHHHPKSQEGPGTPENVSVLCRSCNSAKRDRI